MSGYNAFVRANIAEFADGVIDDYANLIMSQGTMASTSITTILINEDEDQITINWDPLNVSGLQLASDVAYAMFIDPVTKEVGVSSGVLRSAGSIVIPSIEGLNSLSNPHCYLSFKRANGTVISNNSHSTVVESLIACS